MPKSLIQSNRSFPTNFQTVVTSSADEFPTKIQRGNSISLDYTISVSMLIIWLYGTIISPKSLPEAKDESGNNTNYAKFEKNLRVKKFHGLAGSDSSISIL